MCLECQEIEKQIAHYRRFLQQRFDVLTETRIQELIADLQRQKDAMH